MKEIKNDDHNKYFFICITILAIPLIPTMIFFPYPFPTNYRTYHEYMELDIGENGEDFYGLGYFRINDIIIVDFMSNVSVNGYIITGDDLIEATLGNGSINYLDCSINETGDTLEYYVDESDHFFVFFTSTSNAFVELDMTYKFYFPGIP